MAYLGRLLPFFWKNLLHGRMFLSAGSLAFQTLLSFVPFLAVVLSALRIFPFFTQLSRHVEKFLLQNFVPSPEALFHGYIEEFVGKASSMPVLGGVMLFGVALSLISTIDHTFNDIWKVRISRKPMQAFTLYWTVLTLGPLLIGGSLAVSSYLWYRVFTDGPLLELKLRFINFVPFLNSFAAFFLLYSLVPNRRVKLFHALTGALMAALLFELSKKGFVFYISHFATFEHIYGAIAAVPMLFFWIYISWLVVLSGVQLVFSIDVVGRASFVQKPEKTLQGLAPLLSVLGAIWHAQQCGSVVRSGNRNMDPALKGPVGEKIVEMLLQRDVIHETVDGGLAIGIDPYATTLFELYHAMPRELASLKERSGVDDAAVLAVASIEEAVTAHLRSGMHLPLVSLLKDSFIQRS